MIALNEETGMPVLVNSGEVEYCFLPHQAYNRLAVAISALRQQESAYRSVGETEIADLVKVHADSMESMLELLIKKKAV